MRSQPDTEPDDEGLEDELEAPEPADDAGDADGYFVIPVEVLERWRLDLHGAGGRFA